MLDPLVVERWVDLAVVETWPDFELKLAAASLKGTPAPLFVSYSADWRLV